MNLEYFLAVSFGLGVAGLVSQKMSAPALDLASRVKVSEPETKNLRFQFSGRGIRDALKIAIRSADKARLDRALFELPEIVDLLVLYLRAGDGIYRGLAAIIPRCEGELARELSRVLKAVQFGAALGEQIKSVSIAIPQPQVSEFTNKLALALERGTPLAQVLSELSDSARAELRNRLLRQAGKNETRMLIPLVFLILPITVLFAIYPSLELLNFSFI